MIIVALAGTPEAATADYVCDGTDDEVEINQAIAAAGAAGGDDVFIAAGLYSTTSNVVVVDDNVSIQGAGAGQTILQAAANWHAIAAPSGATLNGAVVFCGVDNFSCQGITVDTYTNRVLCNGIVNVPEGLGPSTTDATQGAVCTNGVIANNEVLTAPGHTYAIWNLRGEHVQILDNTVDGGCTLSDTHTSQEGIEVFGGDDVLIEGNIVSNIGNAAISVVNVASVVPDSSCNDIRILSNSVDFSRIGIYIAPSFDATYGPMDITNVTVSGNTITDGIWRGILVQNDTGSTIDPVHLESIEISGNSIEVATLAEGGQTDASGILLANNTEEGATAFGNITITGNTIADVPNTNFAGHVLLLGYENFTFSDNMIITSDPSSSSQGVTVANSHHFTLADNVIDGAGTHGLYITGSSDFEVDNNTIDNWNLAGTNTAAILVDSVSNYTVTDNEFQTSNITQGRLIVVGTSNAGAVAGNTFISQVSYTLSANVHNLVLVGNAVNGTGNALDNVIYGNALANMFAGEAGNDTYYVGVGDVVVEAAGNGYDIVYTSVSYILAAGVEAEQLTTTNNAGIDPLNLTGNEFGQIVRGNAGNNILNGLGGIDTLIGFAGNDTYYVDNVSDVVVEAAGNGYDIVYTSVSYTLAVGVEAEQLTTTNNAGIDPLNLTGNGFGQIVRGNAGNNILNGLGGIDTLIGFAGNDTYYVDNVGDVVVEAAGAGYDIVYASVNYTLAAGVEVEYLSTNNNGGTDPLNLTGNGFGQILRGNAGNNVLSGLGGNDTYYVDNIGDVVVEAAGAGYDIVYASVNYTLAAGVEVEYLSTNNNAGTGTLNLTGNGFGQTIRGNAGNNILNGGGGADTLIGLGGNDTYFVDSASDIVNEAVGGGFDMVRTLVTYVLAAGAEVETLATTNTAGTMVINLTGNAFNQNIVANAGNNVLNGGGGNDMLNGGAGNDTFMFDTALNAATNVDRITDFNVANDTIQLENAIFTTLTTTGTLAAGAFNTGTAATEIDDRIIYNAANGALFYDADGNGAAAAIQFAMLSTGLALTHADFFVV